MKNNQLNATAFGMNFFAASTLTAGLLMAGCNGGATDSNAKLFTDSTSLNISPSSPEVDALITLSGGSQFETLQRLAWKVTREDGSVVSSCTGSTPSIQCRFTIGGNMIATLDAQDEFGNTFQSQVSFTVIDTAQLKNQPPALVADIYDSRGTLVATYAKDSTLEIGGMNVTKGNYTLRLSRTTDDNDSLSDLVFQVSVNGSALQTVGVNSILSLPTVATYPVTITAKDLSGATTTKQFTAYTKCSDTEVSPISATAANITITAQGTRNFFSYATSGISGGTGQFKYQWDFNGDSIFDNDWTSLATTTAYTLYGGNRTVNLKIWDTACNLFKNVSKTFNFVIPKATVDKLNPAASVGSLNNPDYYFLQADATPSNALHPELDIYQKLGFQANHLQTGPKNPMRVQCQYARSGDTSNPSSLTASLSIKGWNQYSRSLDPLEHYLYLRIVGVKDTMGTGSDSIDTSTASISSAEYMTDGGGDQSSQMYYRKNAACPLTLKITPMQGVAPCTTSGTSDKYAVRIEGIFNCPDMIAGSNHIQMGAQYGAFFCEVQEIDACVGGGGGGGGVPPRGF